MITIYGASDDLVEVDGCEGADEFGTDDWAAVLIGPGATEQMFVRCWFERTGTWQVGVGQVDESVPLAPWPVRIRQGLGRRGDPAGAGDHSVVLEIDAPEGVRLELFEASRA